MLLKRPSRKALKWLGSEQSDSANGCRFVGKLWNPNLLPGEAARGTREEPIFAEQVEPRPSLPGSSLTRH